tara:strand:+ start:2271 stop:2609 length:339 start_codon:yes stop_codon:yes gene_type:complete
MKLSGRRYYWLVLAGLLLGLISGIFGARYEEAINCNLGLMLGMLVIMVVSGICYYTVAWEMWARWGIKFIAVLLVLGVLARMLHPIFLVILFLTPVLYWAGRINGVHDRETT